MLKYVISPSLSLMNTKKLYVFITLLWGLVISAQENESLLSYDLSYFYGNILHHNKDISHLITGHPEGIILSLNKRTDGSNFWEKVYGYPDYGISFIHQNTKDEALGKTYGIYGHINFYFLKRNIMFRLGQGIAYATTPFDLDKNPKNNAYGSDLLSSTYILLNYNKKRVFRGLGVTAGIHILHYSNGNFRAPNTSTNSFTYNFGLQYDIDANEIDRTSKNPEKPNFSRAIRGNFVLRGGLNESDYIGLGQFPFFVLSGYGSKRLSFYSSVQLGVDYFQSNFLRREIEYVSIAFPNRASGNEDYRRAGAFAGHELHVNKLSVITQLGYYFYYPYDFEGRVYARLGLKYNITDRLFAVTSIKSHGAKAEAVEFGIGIKL